MNKQNVLNMAIEYCEKHSLSSDKLRNQEIYTINEEIIFAQPVDSVGIGGLKTDIESQPKPTLIFDTNASKFRGTEYTNRFLAQ